MASSEESSNIEEEEQVHMSHKEGNLDNHQTEELSSKLTIREQIRIKKEREREEEQAQLTFRPTVNQPKKHQHQNDDKSSRFDKLYGDALKRHITSHAKEADSPIKEGNKELTFKPQLSTLGAKQSRSSSRERLGITKASSKSRDVSRERNGVASVSQNNKDGSVVGANSRKSSNSRPNSANGLNSSRTRTVSKEQEASATFRPSISKRAKSIENKRQQESRNIAERLYDQGKVAKEKMEQRKTELDHLRMQECTFTPSITTKSKSSTQANSNLEVTERLRRFEEIKKKKLEEALRRKEEEETEELTFKPKISHRAQSPSSDLTLEERLMAPSKRRNDSRALEEASKELTFKPKLIAKRSPSV